MNMKENYELNHLFHLLQIIRGRFAKSHTLFFASMLAPPSTSRRTHSMRPFSAAPISGVSPCCALAYARADSRHRRSSERQKMRGKLETCGRAARPPIKCTHMEMHTQPAEIQTRLALVSQMKRHTPYSSSPAGPCTTPASARNPRDRDQRPTPTPSHRSARVRVEQIFHHRHRANDAERRKEEKIFTKQDERRNTECEEPSKSSLLQSSQRPQTPSYMLITRERAQKREL